MDLLYLITGLVLLSLLTYWFLTRVHNHWAKQNVPAVPNPLPFFGHMWSVFCFKESTSVSIQRMYNSTEASMIGLYFMHRPTILLRDPELVKSVFQTNYASFHSNLITVNESRDPVMAKNPFVIRDLEKWKVARARAISHFSGKKLRDLFVIVREVSIKINAFVDRKIEENGGAYECELRNLFTKFTGEIVANAAFAIEGQSFEDNPHKLAFTNVAPTIFEPSLMNGIKQSLLFYLPAVAEFLRVNFLDKKAEAYFRENLKAIVKERRQSNAMQNDFLQFCIDANSGDNIDGIIADVIIFYLDTYETTSLASSYLFYYISVNKDVQDKLRKHIKEVLEPSKGVVTYESLKSMNYLEQVLNETMRMTPPLGVHMKACTEEITLTGSDGLKCHLKPGDLAFISSAGLHMDSKYWPEPEVFNPDRFSAENQVGRSKYVFFPFGEGPRMCLGMRFAMVMIKLLTAALITNYSLEPSSKTKVPFEIESGSVMTMVKGGLWAKFKKLS